MPVDLQLEQMNDVIYSATRILNRGKMTDISQPSQKFVAMDQLWKNKEMKSGGWGFQWDINVALGTNARFVGLFSEDNVDATDGLIQGQFNWRHAEWAYAFDYHEVDFTGPPDQIVSLLKARKMREIMKFYDMMETNFWGVTSASNTTAWHGVSYWLPKTGATTTGGFNGTYLSGYTTVGNVSPDTYAGWRNYNALYSQVTRDDLIAKWADAADYTYFEPPAMGERIPSFNTGQNYGYYTTKTVYNRVKTILQNQNEDLGMEVDAFQGKAMFRGRPIQWVPYLDWDTTDPVYGINWGLFKIIGRNGWWGKVTDIKQVPGKHNVAAVFEDYSGEYICYDRRQGGFVLATATTYPS